MNKNDYFYEDGMPFYGIFREISLSGQYTKEEKFPLFTLQEEDDDLPSAHKIYMSAMNEYEAAIQIVPTWEFWKNMLKTSVKIRRVVDQWREEKYQKDQAAARRLLWEAAQKGNVSAQRILYEARKEEKQQAARQRRVEHESMKEQEMLQERLARLTELKVVR
jgi:hypothetical protein